MYTVTFSKTRFVFKLSFVIVSDVGRFRKGLRTQEINC